MLALAGAVLGGCAETQLVAYTAKRVGKVHEAPKAAATYKIGSPYRIESTWYYPAVDYGYDETGIASWYGSKFDGGRTANGEIFDMNALSAAHRTLPLPSVVRVTNLENGRSMVLRVNDRGPFARGRIIDVSRRAAQLLGFHRNGTARVRVQIMANESRVVAARLKGEATLAKIGTPIIVARLPSPTVSSAALPPPPGAAAAPVPASSSASSSPVGQGVDGAPADGVDGMVPELAASGPGLGLGVVSVVPVRPTRVFVQAGAFAQFDNANRVRARLANLGPVKVTSVLVNGRDLFRVRAGPLASVTDADRILKWVIDAGYPDARIIVD
jgi:rare lipoprotein A